jgi:FkbM family methyltransferase
MASTFSLRFQISKCFTFYELLILFSGKLFLKFRSSLFKQLQDKENKLSILFQNCDDVSIGEERAFVKYKIGNALFSFQLRLAGSDVWVFNQVILNSSYQYLLDVYNKEFGLAPTTIVDAGANIGVASIYFSAFCSNSTIMAIECDAENIEIAKQNTSVNSLSSIRFIQAALWPTSAKLSIMKDFRDKLEWSFRVKEDSNGDIVSITPQQVVSGFSGSIDIFKIDIEGGESNLFNSTTDLNWLKTVKMIAMEIHEEVSPREKILLELKKFNFDLSYHGELIVCVNKDLTSVK